MKHFSSRLIVASLRLRATPPHPKVMNIIITPELVFTINIPVQQ